MKYSLYLKESAEKSLGTLAKPIRSRVDQHILALANNPRPQGAIPLKGAGKGIWRLRVGDYRILYQIEDQNLTVLVIDVAHRREVYRGL